jgi:DHA1 family tetracycline resistance protein-like MFS transporter
MTQEVGPSEQGRLQGALGSLMGIAMIIAPLLYPQVFAAAIDAKDMAPGWPLLGAPFFVAAALLVAALVAATAATKPKP